jgi:hypothetical protein
MHACPNCGYCPHCGRSDEPRRPRPIGVRPYPWGEGEAKAVWIAPYPGWGGIEVGDRPEPERGFTTSTVTSSVDGTVSYI